MRRILWLPRFLALAILFEASFGGPSGDDVIRPLLDSGVTADALKNLPLDQLAKFVAMELHAEEKRPAEPILPLHEFQDIQDLDCEQRLILLLNRTFTLRDEVHAFRNDITGIAGLMTDVLGQAPDENSWVWLMLNTRERLVQRVHGHFSRITAIALDRQECLMTEIRVKVLEAVVEWKELHSASLAMQWDGLAFGGYGEGGAALGVADTVPTVWTNALVAMLDWTMRLETWANKHTESLFRAMERELPQGGIDTTGSAARMHHQDEQGMFVPYEYMRRKAFNQWALDKGLLRALIRNVWQPGYADGDRPLTVGDFGAGGGQYSTWLNETGLLQAFAFDGTKLASQLTNGAVSEINLIEDTHLWRVFDWVMCLEVGEHIPKQFSTALLRNLRRHATEGLVMSWSDDWEGIGHVNCLSKADFVAFVQRETGFYYDEVATEAIKRGCEIDYIARTIAVFRASDVNTTEGSVGD